MKTALYGRIVFGASAVLFGIVALMWHDADTWQNLHRILSLPFGPIVGACLMIALIIGGVAILHPRTAHGGSIVLGVLYGIFSIVCISDIIVAPRIYAQYGSFFEQFSLVCGAAALFAATAGKAPRAAAVARAARLGLGLCVVSFTLSQIIYFRVTADLVPKWILPSQEFWAVLTTIAFALAAIAILIDYQARLALRLLTLMLALFGILVWVPLLVAHPEAHLNWSEFALNFLITGAVWMVADSEF